MFLQSRAHNQQEEKGEVKQPIEQLISNLRKKGNNNPRP